MNRRMTAAALLAAAALCFAAGAYLLHVEDNSTDITGTYEIVDGIQAFLIDDGVTYIEDLKDMPMEIETFDGKRFSAECAGSLFVGTSYLIDSNCAKTTIDCRWTFDSIKGNIAKVSVLIGGNSDTKLAHVIKAEDGVYIVMMDSTLYNYSGGTVSVGCIDAGMKNLGYLVGVHYNDGSFCCVNAVCTVS